MNKKLFKGALALFASILMAVSCSSNQDSTNNDPGNNPNNPGATTPEVNVSAEKLATLFTGIKTAQGGTADAKVDLTTEGSKDIHIDFTSFALTKDTKDKNNFNGKQAVLLKKGKGNAGTAPSAADTIKNSAIQTKLLAVLKATVGDTGVTVDSVTVNVASGGVTGNEVVINFTDSAKVKGTIKFTLNVDSELTTAAGNDFKVVKG